MDIKQSLSEEVLRELKQMKGMELGTEQYRTTVNGVGTLVDKTIELTKLEADKQERLERKEVSAKTMDSEKKDRLIQNSIAMAGILIPAMITVWGTVKSFEFEEEGTITTIMGRGFINKLLPRK